MVIVNDTLRKLYYSLFTQRFSMKSKNNNIISIRHSSIFILLREIIVLCRRYSGQENFHSAYVLNFDKLISKLVHETCLVFEKSCPDITNTFPKNC